MEKIFLDSKSQYDSSATFIWTPDKINAHFVIGFVSFTLMRMLQAKLDFQFSMEQIGISLQRYNCVQIAGNIYQFTYYDVILDACEKALKLELHNKYRSRLQIRETAAVLRTFIFFISFLYMSGFFRLACYLSAPRLPSPGKCSSYISRAARVTIPSSSSIFNVCGSTTAVS